MLRVLLSAFILFGLCVSAGVPAAYAKNKTPVQPVFPEDVDAITQ